MYANESTPNRPSLTTIQVTELMKPKKPRMDVPPTYDKARHDPASQQTQRYGRLALGQYALHPEAFPPSRVIYYDDKFVVINDSEWPTKCFVSWSRMPLRISGAYCPERNRHCDGTDADLFLYASVSQVYRSSSDTPS